MGTSARNNQNNLSTTQLVAVFVGVIAFAWLLMTSHGSTAGEPLQCGDNHKTVVAMPGENTQLMVERAIYEMKAVNDVPFTQEVTNVVYAAQMGNINPEPGDYLFVCLTADNAQVAKVGDTVIYG